MNVKVNTEAVEFARQLVGDGNYRASFANANGTDAAERWHLALDLDAPEGSADRLLYPVGDFANVHESALRSVKQRAENAGQTELADAAENVLDMFYRVNAC
jgi:hypothetical protein